jgi:hypothetical protein
MTYHHCASFEAVSTAAIRLIGSALGWLSSRRKGKKLRRLAPEIALGESHDGVSESRLNISLEFWVHVDISQ